MKAIGTNTVTMIKNMPPLSPFRQQLIPSITVGLTSPEAATALGCSRQTISKARRNLTYNPDNMFPPTTPNILTTAYPLGTKRPRKSKEKHSAARWLKDHLPVKSGSKYEVHTQHDTNYKLYEDYRTDMEAIGNGT